MWHVTAGRSTCWRWQLAWWHSSRPLDFCCCCSCLAVCHIFMQVLLLLCEEDIRVWWCCLMLKDGHEVCFVGDEAFCILSQQDPHADSLLSAVSNIVIAYMMYDRNCTAQYNFCLPATADCRRFCRFWLFFVLFNFVQCLWHDSVTLISTLLLTYLLIDVSNWWRGLPHISYSRQDCVCVVTL